MANKKPVTISLDLEEFSKEKFQDLLDVKPWMKTREFTLINDLRNLSDFIDRAIAAGKCVIDFETTGLNTRTKKVKDPLTGQITKVPVEDLVGVGLCYESKASVYIPMKHYIGENLEEALVLEELRRLCAFCIVIFHNAKFDVSQLHNRGIFIDGAKKFEDTQLLARLYNANQKDLKLKNLSERLLNQPMLKFKEITQSTNRFDLVDPQQGYYYGASDAICTFDLYNFFMASPIVQEQTQIYNIEKRVVFAVMKMEANLVRIDVEFLKTEKDKVQKRLKDISQDIFTLAKHEFNIGSPLQLGKVLFEELGFKSDMPRTASGQYATDNAALKKLAQTQPICKKLIAYRSLEKSLGTYIENLINNVDEDGCVKFGFHQSGTDTGRFSSPGGSGLLEDGYSGVNVQSVPKATKDDDSGEDLPDIRRAVIARDGKTIVAADYENEEMRVAANLSNETTWIDAVNKGIDFHTATGAIISGKSTDAVTPEERKLGKTTNFLSLYLGGARTLAGNAGISEAEAKRILNAFFAGVPRLKSWIDREIKKARKSKIVKTLLGRVRPLSEFYDSEDRGLQNHGDRCVINTQVQGCLQAHERCLTTEGYLPIYEIRELKKKNCDLKVWTGTSWEAFDVIDRGPSQLAQIELLNGLKIDVDVRHEVLVEEVDGYKFKKFEDLNENTRICTSIPTEKEFGTYPGPFNYYGNSHNATDININTSDQWINMAYLLGCIIGDGVVSIIEDKNHYIVQLCFGKEKIKDLMPKIRGIVESIGLKIGDPILSKGSIGTSYRVPIYSKAIVFLLKFMGYNYSNALNKRVPEIIFRSPIAMRKAFLRGYYDTDGSKSEGNRHCFHTPNESLLKDVQLIGWTLGCGSVIHIDKQGAYILKWMDTWAIEKSLNLDSPYRKRRNNSDNYIMPKFKQYEIIKILDNVVCDSNKDRSYKCKIKKGHSVCIPGVIQFLQSHNVEIPELYYAYPLKSKKVIDKVEDTYTLSVHSPLHRYDSAGIISKNCSADIMKTVMAKIHSWILVNNLEEDVKVLITMHDELVFEVTTEKLELLVPEITKIMMLREVVNDVFKWPIPLTVDVKYGNSWRVKKKFYEDFPHMRARLSEPLMKLRDLNLKSPIVEAVMKDPMPPAEAISLDSSTQPIVENKNVYSNPSPEIILENKPPAINEKEFLYILRDTGDITLLHLNAIIKFSLKEQEKNSDRYVSPKKILRVRDQEGYSLMVSEYLIPVDLFLGLARFFKI